MESKERGDRVDFDEVVKLATLPEPSTGSTEEKKEDSGMVHLSALAAGEGSESAPPPPSPPAVLPPIRPPARSASAPPAPLAPLRSTPPGAPQLAAAVRSLPPPSAPPIAANLPTAAAVRIQPKRWGTPALGVALVGGMVIGVAFSAGFFATRSIENRVVVMAPAAEPKTATAPNDRSGVPSPPPSAPTAITPANLPLAAARTPNPQTPSAMHAGLTPTSAIGPAAQSAQQTAGAAGSQAQGVSPGPSTASDQSLEALMNQAVGATERSLPTATTAIAAALPQNVPPKPALGAVQGAIGTVLPAARYCLGPDDPVSRATLTFKSDGSVQSVAVSGDAAGQPAEACIRSRLMGARVPPFSNPTFTWTVTVRPAS